LLSPAGDTAVFQTLAQQEVVTVVLSDLTHPCVRRTGSISSSWRVISSGLARSGKRAPTACSGRLACDQALSHSCHSQTGAE
jgi:hypothetical protein